MARQAREFGPKETEDIRAKFKAGSTIPQLAFKFNTTNGSIKAVVKDLLSEKNSAVWRVAHRPAGDTNAAVRDLAKEGGLSVAAVVASGATPTEVMAFAEAKKAEDEAKRRAAVESEIAAALRDESGIVDGAPETSPDERFKTKAARASFKAVKLSERALDKLAEQLEIADSIDEIADCAKGVKVASESIAIARTNYYKIRNLENDDTAAKTAGELLAKGFTGIIDSIVSKYEDQRHGQVDVSPSSDALSTDGRKEPTAEGEVVPG